jgi:LuxR family maltose regulon positive regulatory protein
MLAATSLAYVYHDLGQISKSSEVCESALERADAYRRKHGRILPAAAGVYAIQAHNFYWQYDLERAYWYAKRAVTFSEIWGQMDIIIVAGWIMARVLSARNEPEAAFKVLETAWSTNKTSSEWDAYLEKLCNGYILFGAGNLEGTQRVVGELAEFEDKVYLDLSNFYLHWELSIKILIMDGKCDQALDRIDQLLAHFKDNRGGYKTNALVLRAWACHKMGNEGEALVALQTALHYAEPEVHVLPFVEALPYLEKPLRSIAAKGKYRQILEHIFSLRQASLSGQATILNQDIRPDGENLIEPLTERELEILRLLNSHLPTPEIADMLAVSVNTVRTHIKSIYSKLGVHSRSTAIAVSKKLKLLA